VTKSLFEAIGYKLGRKAAQAKNAFDLMGGDDEESLRAEIRLGRDLASALLQRVPLVEENDSTRFASQIGRWLSTNVKEKKLPFSVQVTAEEEPIARALPGGPVFLSWPLLEICQGERDEIAFLIGHEMGHVVRRHTLDRIVKDAAVSLLLRQSSGKLAAISWLNNAGGQLLSQGYSREQEYEADCFAAFLVRAAGGDALAGEHLLGKIARETTLVSVNNAGNYFATHPPPMERLANLRSSRQD
jgi:Zn-dependent protease with chaperone function